MLCTRSFYDHEQRCRIHRDLAVKCARHGAVSFFLDHICPDWKSTVQRHSERPIGLPAGREPTCVRLNLLLSLNWRHLPLRDLPIGLGKPRCSSAMTPLELHVPFVSTRVGHCSKRCNHRWRHIPDDALRSTGSFRFAPQTCAPSHRIGICQCERLAPQGDPCPAGHLQ